MYKRCIEGNIPNVRSCIHDNPPSFNKDTSEEMCHRLTASISTCLNDKIGRPCGYGGLEVYRRITEASKPFLTGICLESAGITVEDASTHYGIDYDTETETDYGATVTLKYPGARRYTFADTTTGHDTVDDIGEAFIGGATSHFLCILEQLIAVSPDHFFLNPDFSCQDVEIRFDQVRKDLKECTPYEIDTTLLESLHNDFCNATSDYRQNFNKQKACLSENRFDMGSCLQDKFTFEIENYSRDKELCTSTTNGLTNCIKEAISEVCGDGGLKVSLRIMEASKPFFKGICLQAIDDAIVDNAETAAVENIENKGEEVKSSSSAANTAFFWIILGLFLVVKLYNK